jgi:beta-lactam-binding protein with PASTA domain
MLFALAILIILIFLFFYSLKCITKHGDTLKIPSVTGNSFSEAKKTLESQGFAVVIQDSIYIDTIAPLTVLKQFPEGDELVKINREVYLTVNRSVPPVIDMPELTGKTLRIALMDLDRYGLKLGDTTFKEDFAVGSILNQLYEGKEIKPGTKIPMGSKISLVVAILNNGEDIPVPDLVGMTFGEAKAALEANGLILGASIFKDNLSDKDAGYVTKQSPERMDEEKRINRVRKGQYIDLWINKERKITDTDDNE